MNLDDLISKYLDGELTPENDAELRQLINEDVTAKQDFDAHVLIHAALKEDASAIRPSMNLVGKTEDKILSRYLKEKPAAAIRYERPRRRVLAFASIAFAVLILGFFTISDIALYQPATNKLALVLNNEKAKLVNSESVQQTALYFEENNNQQELVMSVPAESRRNITPGTIQNIANNRVNSNRNSNNPEIAEVRSTVVSPVVRENSGIMAASVDNSNVVENSITPTPVTLSPAPENVQDKPVETIKPDNAQKQPVENMFAQDNAVIENTTPLTKEKSGSGNSLSMMQPTQSSQIINTNLGGHNLAELNQSFYGPVSEIRLSSFLGTEVVQGGFNTDNVKFISNFSQGIAYNLNEDNRIGFDIGYSSYSYNDTKIGRLPNLVNYDGSGSSANMGQSGVLVRDQFGNSLIEFPYTVNIQKQMMWGAGFFERTLLITNFLKVD